MRKLRNFRLDRCYHLISRVAHRAFYLTDEEKTRFVAWMWRVARFSGVKILAYCVMTNHFHLLVHVPPPQDLSDEEFMSRLRAMHSGERMSRLEEEWTKCAGPERRLAFKQRFLRRMWNVSEFMKTLKQGWTMAYNERRVHSGTMWESRFRVRDYASDELIALMAVAGYIDRNPVKAGLVARTEDYAWCGFSAAVTGDERCRDGYRFVYGFVPQPWPRIREQHEQMISVVLRELEEDEVGRPGRKGLSVDEEKREKIISRAMSDACGQMPDAVPGLLGKGSDKVAVDLLRLLAQAPHSPAQLRAALGISSANYFTSRYLTPLEKSGHVAIAAGCSRFSPNKTFELTRKGKSFVESLPS